MNDLFIRHKSLIGYLTALSGVVAVTSILVPFRDLINTTIVALALLLVTLLVATIFGSKTAFLSSFLGVLAFNFFFLPPFHTLSISEPQNWAALAVFLIVAVTVGELSAKARHRAEEAERLYGELQDAFEKTSQAEALRQSEKLKSALLDAVTHDLRTPLTSIKASITMLIEEHGQDSIHITLEPEGRRELLEVINEESDRLNNFVESMVELARLEAGNMAWRKSRTSVEEIIANALQRTDRLAVRHNISVDIGSDLPLLSADSKAIAEVVYNLIDNAAKYSPENSQIKVSARKVRDKIEFSVEDEGKGVAAEDREKVFEKFYRGDKSSKGFGLGLAIVRGIVEAHGGTIRIEDGAIGSRFVFDLPVSIDE
jgi:K+-sensing histidine kinase KdpD